MRQELTCASSAQVFAEMDTDYSGFLSRDEIAQLLEKVYGDGTHLVHSPHSLPSEIGDLLLCSLRELDVETPAAYPKRTKPHLLIRKSTCVSTDARVFCRQWWMTLTSLASTSA